MNIFNTPTRYKKQILKEVIVSKNKQKQFKGKTFLCVFFTKFCQAGCPFCFFKSDTRKFDIPQEKFEFSQFGFERFISFLNSSNNGYLLISGGGEPFEKEEYIFETIKRAKTDRIVIVTSGYWAKDFNKATETIKRLYESLNSRNDNLKLVVRLSLDKFHNQQLGSQLVYNIVDIFRKNYKNNNQFILQIHTMMEDNTVENVMKQIGNCRIESVNDNTTSDNDILVKIIPKRCKIVFNDGYEIPVGIAKIFYPNLKVNLSKKYLYQKAIKVFEDDMILSENTNPSIVENTDGDYGLDFWLNYNGNVTTWGNQQLDNLYNLYTDNYQYILNDICDNIISYSFLDKGYFYREKIIREINKKAVLRSKVSNIRDYSGALILEEEHTALFYAIRVIQDYLTEGILEESDISKLPKELIQTIKMNRNELIKMYSESNFCILEQYKNDSYNMENWIEIFILITLGHYDITQQQIKEGIKYYNQKFNESIKALDDFKEFENVIEYSRFIERITFMKPESSKYCIERGI